MSHRSVHCQATCVIQRLGTALEARKGHATPETAVAVASVAYGLF